jgi:hypothetical protein
MDVSFASESGVALRLPPHSKGTSPGANQKSKINNRQSSIHLWGTADWIDDCGMTIVDF